MDPTNQYDYDDESQPDSDYTEDDWDNTSNTSLARKQRQEEEKDGGSEYDEEEDDDSVVEENQHQKLQPSMKQSLMDQYYPELQYRNAKELDLLLKITRNDQGQITDMGHRTTPILTKFERTRILGERAKQLQQGAQPFVEGMENIIDSYAIAEEELKRKVLPFIIERPLPMGSCEYWHLADLEIL